jgi:hypothetical protein
LDGNKDFYAKAYSNGKLPFIEIALNVRMKKTQKEKTFRLRHNIAIAVFMETALKLFG